MEPWTRRPGFAGSVQKASSRQGLRIGDIDHGQALVGRGDQGRFPAKETAYPRRDGERTGPPILGSERSDLEAVEKGAVRESAPDLDVMGLRPERRARKTSSPPSGRCRPGRRRRLLKGSKGPVPRISICACPSFAPAQIRTPSSQPSRTSSILSGSAVPIPYFVSANWMCLGTGGPPGPALAPCGAWP